MPQLDEDAPRAASRPSTPKARARPTCRPAWKRCKALQEKVKTDGKLAPWLAKHGLDGLQGLWSRIHIEQGWENALEAALRERLGALEVVAARHGARLRATTRRRPSWPSTARRRPARPRRAARCRAWPTCCA